MTTFNLEMGAPFFTPRPLLTSPITGIYRPLAYWDSANTCSAVNGPNTSCRVVILGNVHTYLTAENCYNGVDDDGNGLIDKADPGCWRCGDG